MISNNGQGRGVFFVLPSAPHHLKQTYLSWKILHLHIRYLQVLGLVLSAKQRVLKREDPRRVRAKLFICLFWVEEDGRGGPRLLPSQQSEKCELRGHGDRGEAKASLFPGRRRPCGWLESPPPEGGFLS